ncbi:phage tail assembly chaperone G [Faecalispora jeddahensis]|uniref:phage tail assembly chaperone G n=1 Tax=Faecalispora jeddahensis TaxID=1414721 RepID=UPI0028AB9D1D|nr:hypothetical protein [Faecalispora jeddahensis]
MKTLTLQIGDKLYTTGRITAWQSREAFAINKAAIDAVKVAENMDENDIDQVSRIYQVADDLAIRKLNLICEVYSRKFTADELEKALTNEEIEEQMQKIMKGITGVVEKN